MTKLLSKHFETPVLRTENLLGLTLLLYPVLLFIVQGGMNGSLFLVAIVSILLLVAHRKDANYSFDKWAVVFGIAMSSGMVVVFVSQAYHQDIAANYFDSNARFLLAAPILVALRALNMRMLSLMQYAFPLGAIAALVMVLITDPTVSGVATIPFLNHIHLGDMALLLGFLSVLSIDWFGKDRMTVKVLKVSGLLAGLVVSVLSGARGGWVAIPVIVAISIYARNKHRFFSKLALALLAIFAAILLGYFFVEPIHQRLWAIYSDLYQFKAGNADTSIGVRFQLWKSAVRLIAENPLLGVGADGFGRAMDGLRDSGFITHAAAIYGKAEVHNEILAQTVRFGIFGLCFILSVYFVPFYMFFKALGTASHPKRVAAIMGMSVTLGFFMFGLTVETFDLKMTAAFYSLTVAALLAVATNRHPDTEATTRGVHV